MDRNSLLNDSEMALRLAMDGRLATLWTTMPGIVQSVDLSKMTVSVQPAIQAAVEDEFGAVTFVNLPLLVDVPLKFPSNKNFIITFPIESGDEVEVTIASRCIDAWWQSGGVQKPLEARMHDLSDGFAYPGLRSLPNVPDGISSTELQIRNNSGSAYVALTPDGKIKLVSAAKIEVAGDIEVTGKITATGEIQSGLIGLTTHKHGGVTVGGGSTGPGGSIMRYRKLTSDGDYSFGAGQQDFLKDVPEAPGQAAQTRLELWLGEWFLNILEGTPYFQGVLGKYTKEEADVTIQDRILDSQGVVNIDSYESEVDSETRTYSASVVLNTVYGPTALKIDNFKRY